MFTSVFNSYPTIVRLGKEIMDALHGFSICLKEINLKVYV